MILQDLVAGQRVLILSGELSATHAADLHRLALQVVQEPCDLRIDGRQLQSIDLASLQVLLALADALAARGKRMELSELSPSLRDDLLAAGVTRLAAPPGDSPFPGDALRASAGETPVAGACQEAWAGPLAG